MKFILGKKVGMGQIYKDNKVIPVTIIQAGPCIVVNKKESEKNKYSAVQLGFNEKRKIKKPVFGQINKLGNFSVIREFRLPEDNTDLDIGAFLKADVFNEGDLVNIAGLNKGKGFQGVVKRHGFKTWPRTHGHPHQRQPGSIGCMTPQRVVKGKRMAGRMGNARVTIKNLTIADIDSANNLLIVKGAVPGRRGTVLEIREAGLNKLGVERKFPKRKK